MLQFCKEVDGCEVDECKKAGAKCRKDLVHAGASCTTGEDKPVQLADDPILFSVPPWLKEESKSAGSSRSSSMQATPEPAIREPAMVVEDPPPMGEAESIRSDIQQAQVFPIGAADGPAEHEVQERRCCGEWCVLSPVRRIGVEQVMRDAHWCCYLFCCGISCDRNAPADFRLVQRCICCSYRCEDVECQSLEGYCGSMLNCCCCVTLCQIPPRHGSPRCICCGENRCGTSWNKKEAETAIRVAQGIELPRTSNFEFFMFEHDVCCYLCCCGLGVTSKEKGKTKCSWLAESDAKCCCLRCGLEATSCSSKNCNAWLSCMWLIALCSFPPEKLNNPIVSCCGCKCRKQRPMVPTYIPKRK